MNTCKTLIAYIMKTNSTSSFSIFMQYRYSKGLFNCLVLLFLFTLQTNAQEVKWDKTLGGDSWDRLRHIQKTSDGGYILGGTSLSGQSGDKSAPSRGDSDYWVVKLDAEGNKLWDKSFGGSGRDELQSVQQTSDGGYILGGSSASGISGDKTENTKGGFDYWVIKLDADGNKIWDKTFGGSSSDQLYDLQQSNDGGYILGGTSFSGISGDKTEASRGEGDYWVVKIDENGVKEWDRTFGGDRLDYLSSLDQTADGGYILGGTSDSNASGDKSEGWKGSVDITLEAFDYWVVKLDADGNKEWDKTIGGHNFDSLNEVMQTTDGGYILGGSSVSGISGDKSEASSGGESDFWLVKLDEQGNVAWDRTFGADKGEQLSALLEITNGGYLLGGTSYASDMGGTGEPGEDDFWVLMVNAAGEKQWDRYIGGDGTDVLSSMDLTDDGGYILGGSSTSGTSRDKTEPNIGLFDYWVVKLGPEPPCTSPTPVISVVATSDVYTGGEASTIYLGYGPQSVQLVASGAESYEWSPAVGLSNTSVANPVFMPTAAGTYTFTLTAYNGNCTATANVTITVIDVRCDNGKVLVCHKGKQICIAASAVVSHLRNHKEDKLGNCSSNLVVKDRNYKAIPLRVYPNPFKDWANIEFSLPEKGMYRLELYHANGKMLGVVAEGKGEKGELVHKELKGWQLREGIYYLRLITHEKVQTLRLMHEK